MRDLFDSTNFIKFGDVETILSSSDAVTKLIEGEQVISEDRYTLNDYLSNLDSYLYGVVQLLGENIEEIKKWIFNYIEYLYIPLVNRNPLYIVKSRFINEIFKLEENRSRIDENLKSYLLDRIIIDLKYDFDLKEQIVEELLLENKDEKNFIEYLVNYYNIYRNKEYINKIYRDNESFRIELEKRFDFL